MRKFKDTTAKLWERKSGIMYCLHDVANNICRIGVTATANHSRYKQQIAYYPYELKPFYIKVSNIFHAERYYHKTFADKNVKGDWFSITPKDFLCNKLKRDYQKVWEKDYQPTIIHKEKVKFLENLKKIEDEEKAKKHHQDIVDKMDKMKKWATDIISSASGKDKCSNCKNCYRFEKTITVVKDNKKLNEIHSNGFMCDAMEIEMFPRKVIQMGLLQKHPEWFYGNKLMPEDCDKFDLDKKSLYQYKKQNVTL